MVHVSPTSPAPSAGQRFSAWMAGLLAVLLLGLSPGVSAQVDDAMAERVMKASGIWEQLAHLGPQIKQGFQTLPSQPGAPADAAVVVDRLATATDQAFGDVAVRLAARRELARRLDPAQMPALLAWFDSAVGRRITALEVAHSADMRDPTLRQQEGERLIARATAARRQLLDDHLEASRGLEATARAVTNLLLAMQSGMAAAMGRSDMPPLSQLLAEAEPRQAGLREELRPMVQALSAELYATVSDADLAAYVQMLRSPAGRNLTDAALHALDRVVLERAEEVGRLAAPRFPGA